MPASSKRPGAEKRKPAARSGGVDIGGNANVGGDIIGRDKIVYAGAPPAALPLQRPRRAEHFTGRETELKQLVADLQPSRVVTLCGPGGIGKTALAAEAVWTLAPGEHPPPRFPDGVIVHTFYTEAQAALALEAVARAYSEDPRPTPTDAARRVLSRRCALLVLDGAENADDLDAVLAIVGGCGVLITTRRHHDAPGQWHDIAPLPSLKAVELLQAWGGDYAADERAAATICELVGGLPLAVTLAGKYLAQRRQDAADYLAWLQATPLAALHFGDRQRDSVPVLMERSLAQVSESARRTLAVVGLLDQASFAREIIPHALDLPPADANRSLGELVDYGLLLRTGQRYQVSHALVHTYARQNLLQPADALTRLADYYDALAQEQSALGPSGFAALDPERAHILAIQSACLAAQQWEYVRRLTWAVEDYLDLQGHLTARITLIEAGLAAARASAARYDEGAFLNLLGNAYADLGDARRAIEYHGQQLVIVREIGDRRGEGAALGNLGVAYAALGDARRAIEFYEQALVIDREISAASRSEAERTDARRGEGAALGNLGLAYAALGDARRAIEYHEQDLVIAREIGDRRGEGNALGNLGSAYAALGDARRAIEFYEQRMVIAREIGDRRGEGTDLGNLGNAYAALGDARRAIEYHEQALVIDREIGDRRGEGAALFNLSLSLDKLGEREKAIASAKAALSIYEQIESLYADRVRKKLAEWQA